jgi:hypothetical protein
MPDEGNGAPEVPGLTRRAALKRLAAAGGVVWAVPVVQTLNMRSAAAQTTSPRTECYCVKWDPSDDPACHEDPEDVCDVCPADVVSGGCAPGHFTVSQNVDGTWTVILAPGCSFLEGFAVSKCSHDLCEPAVPNASATAATFFPCVEPDPPPDGTHDISHIDFVFCCEVG